MTTPEPAVVCRDVRKIYRLGDGSDLVAVDNATGQLAEGSFATIMGPSGSGKSTLLHLIGALDPMDAGTITVFGQDISALRGKDLDDYRSRTGFIFQKFHLVSSLDLLHNVLLPVLPRKVDFDKRVRALELLDTVGLGGRADALPHQLSGGQQQRVAIARALIMKPRLLLGDEPTGNLDSQTSASILELLHQINREFETTVLLATHDPAIAAQATTRWTISDGRLTA